jgi:hypothetical protein
VLTHFTEQLEIGTGFRRRCVCERKRGTNRKRGETLRALAADYGGSDTDWDFDFGVVLDDLEGIPISADGQVDLDTAPFDVFSWRRR